MSAFHPLLKFKLGHYQIVTRSTQKTAREAHGTNSGWPARAGQSGRQNLPRLARGGHADAGDNWADLWHTAATPSVVFAGRRQWPLAQVVAPPFAIYSPSI
jgi:hypothetical protein